MRTPRISRKSTTPRRGDRSLRLSRMARMLEDLAKGKHHLEPMRNGRWQFDPALIQYALRPDLQMLPLAEAIDQQYRRQPKGLHPRKALGRAVLAVLKPLVREG